MAFVKSEFTVYGQHHSVADFDDLDVVIDSELQNDRLLGLETDPDFFLLMRITDWVGNRPWWRQRVHGCAKPELSDGWRPSFALDGRCSEYACAEWHTCDHRLTLCPLLS